jgi:DNA 3'-phosphatase
MQNRGLLQRFVLWMSLICALPAAWAAIARRTFAEGTPTPVNGKMKVAFFDADSTLRIAPSGSPSANSVDDVMKLPDVADKIAELDRQGYLVVIVSNQAGVPRYVSMEVADGALMRIRELVREENPKAIIHYHDFAETITEDRKPGIGMALRLERLLKEKFGTETIIDKENSFMVGDAAYKHSENGQPAERRPDGREGMDMSNSDRLFAVNYGIKFFEPADFFGWRKYGIDRFDHPEQITEYLKRKKSACESPL